jgi:hypothetical protein
MTVTNPYLGAGDFRGQEPLYEGMASLQAYKDTTGMAASPTASILGLSPLGQAPREAGGFNPNAQRYQTGYQMPRGAGNQGMKAYVAKRLSLM